MEKAIKQLIKLLQSQNTEETLVEVHDLVLSIPVFQRMFRNFSYTSRLSIINNFKLREFKEDDVVYSYGDYCDSIYILLQGSVILYAAHSDSLLVPVKLLNDPVISRSRVFTTNAMARESAYLIQMDLEQYHNFIISELEANIKEKMKYIESLIPGITLCTLAQKEKIAYCLDIFIYQKGTVLCSEGSTADKLQIVLEGECSIIKRISGKNKIL